jgi:hypothetical protein
MHREHYWPFLKGEALEERKFHIGKSELLLDTNEVLLRENRTLFRKLTIEGHVLRFTCCLHVRVVWLRTETG